MCNQQVINGFIDRRVDGHVDSWTGLFISLLLARWKKATSSKYGSPPASHTDQSRDMSLPCRLMAPWRWSSRCPPPGAVWCRLIGALCRSPVAHGSEDGCSIFRKSCHERCNQEGHTAIHYRWRHQGGGPASGIALAPPLGGAARVMPRKDTSIMAPEGVIPDVNNNALKIGCRSEEVE